jgi:hypothetical protein
MNPKRLLICSLTFLGGLYFVLQYVVPPTLPFATKMGVAVAKELPTVTVVTQEGYRFKQEAGDGVTLYVKRRDATGEYQDKDIKSRLVGVGDAIKIRTRSVTLGESKPGEPPKDGDKNLVLRDGEHPFLTEGTDVDPVTRAFEAALGRTNPDGTANLYALAKDEKVNIEVPYCKVVDVSRGAVEMLINGKRFRYPLTGRSLVMRVKRRTDPEEVEVHDVNVGDTLRIGPHTFFRDQMDTAAQFNSVIGTLALGMGLLSLGMVNIRKIKRREKEWYTAILFFSAIAVGAWAGAGHYDPPGTLRNSFSDIVIVQVLGALGSAIFSLTAFYLASAAYRAFRIRTFEAGLMMATALLVMLGQTPFGMYLTGWISERYQFLWLSSIASWILRTPSMAFIRALTFGGMVGGVAQALRYWLSLERVATGGD